MLHALVIAAVAVAAAEDGASAPNVQPPGIALNEDNSHFFGARAPEQMTLEGLHAFVDQYAGTKVSHLFLNPNAMRASFDSATRDAIWEYGNQKVPEEEFHRRWPENCRMLTDRGLDPYAVWIARCREKGIVPWLTMRMNDVHDVMDPTNFMHSTFWVDHPEYWRVPGSTGSWVDRALNYGIPEVREHAMSFVRELLERYDLDGLELDWMRFGYHFAPGEEAAGCEILTQFMRDVRTLANEAAARRGHPVLVGARVPTHPDAAVGLGMDGVRWVKEGLVDMLVPTPFWATADFDIPIELWRERMGDSAGNTVLAAGAEILLRAYPGGQQIENDIESVRGFAAAHLHRGADQIYLFNYMDPAPMQGGVEAYRTLLEQGLGMDEVTSQPRRHVITYRDTVPAGVSADVVLPANTQDNPTFRFYIGPAPKIGSVTFLAGLAEGEGVGEAAFDVTFNGQPCSVAEDHAEPAQFPGAVRAVQFACPLDAIKDGYNEVTIQGQPGQQIVWAQLRIVP